MTFFTAKAPLKQLGWPLILCIGAALAAALGIAIGGKLGTHSALAVGGSPTKSAAASVPATPPEAANLAAAFLSGRHAEMNADADTAVKFYDRVTDLDPENLNAVQSAYFLAVQSGDFAAAVPAAKRSYDANPRRGMASVVLAVDQFKKGDYAKAFSYLPRSSAQSMNAFALPLMRAWTIAALRPADNAVDEIQGLKNFQESANLVDAQTGLLNEFFGRKTEALAAYDALASRIDTDRAFTFSMLRAVVEGYHRLGKDDQIKGVFDRFTKLHAPSPTVEAYAAVATKQPVRKVTAVEGMGEALFMAAELLLMNDPNEVRAQIATAYAQSALYLDPDLDIARRFIGSTLAARGHYDESSTVLGGLKKTAPGYLEVRMQIAENQLRLNKVDDALATLREVLKEKPTWTEALVAQGDILRQKKEFSQAVKSYDDALKTAGNKADNWAIYYSRGIALERNKDWDAAEKDFRKALELKPDDPNILNYLGYSYLDRGVKLGEARKLIESAYKQRPNDGYIIDSFGWALYMNGEYAQAVQNLERAVESTPSDATINEHLGDVYWKVGRRNEARFQWKRALGLETDEALRATLRTKLERGLAQK